jgi:hypothetical protein
MVTPVSKGDTELSHAPESETVDLEETDVFLDAIAARHRMEFDPAQAKAIGNIFKKAAQIVEESRSVEADKPAPRGATSLREAYYGDAWTTVHQYGPPEDFENWHVVDEVSVVPMHGSVYGQSLGKLAGPLDLTESKNPAVAEPSRPRLRSDDLSALRILFLGGIPIATTVSGILLLIASATTDPIVPNPYIALFTFLSGLAFTATAVVAIRERQRD